MHIGSHGRAFRRRRPPSTLQRGSFESLGLFQQFLATGRGLKCMLAENLECLCRALKAPWASTRQTSAGVGHRGSAPAKGVSLCTCCTEGGQVTCGRLPKRRFFHIQPAYSLVSTHIGVYSLDQTPNSGYGLHSDQEGFTSIQTPNLRVWSSLRPKRVYIDPNPKPQGMVFTPAKKDLHRSKPQTSGYGLHSDQKGFTSRSKAQIQG